MATAFLLMGFLGGMGLAMYPGMCRPYPYLLIPIVMMLAISVLMYFGLCSLTVPDRSKLVLCMFVLVVSASWIAVNEYVRMRRIKADKDDDVANRTVPFF